MTPTIREIQERTSKLCGVPIHTMLSYDRTRPVCRARQIAMYTARVTTKASWRQLADSFQRDHKAVRQAVDVIDWHVWHTPEVRAMIHKIGDWARG
ncbi:MAG: helix-turn-helix domain-containing protein [Geminicoccaceae bacterium]